MKRAFTLIELLVVIGIIGILAATLMGNYSGIIARVRSTKCQTNLKNLATAVGTYATEGRYPFAESAQALAEGRNSMVHEAKGWISWLSKDIEFPIAGDSGRSIEHCSYANPNEEDVTFALTNGAIWTAVGKNRDCFLCPEHVEACRKQKVLQPGWSYQMNAYFGYEQTKGSADELWDPRIRTGDLTRADRLLLFAEIPAIDATTSKKARQLGYSLPKVNLTGGNNDDEMCGCLKYKSLQGASGNGSIGFNHVRGRELVGHVAFADGHVESFAAPKDGQFVNLTDWLCQGLDVVIQDKSYQKVENSNE